MLAYVFWHQPRNPEGYEDALREFHASLPHVSASFRLRTLPFLDAVPGYEDWYLVEDWNALGELNATAVDAQHKRPHDAAAHKTKAGWGGVYKLLTDGIAEPPATARWSHRRPEEGAAVLWQRQMVLGPAPEYCQAADGDEAGRTRIA